MKNLVILYGASLTGHAFEKVFGSKSAFEMVLDWAALFAEKIIIFTQDGESSSITQAINEALVSRSGIETLSREKWTKSLFISEISSLLKKNHAENALVSYADTPFLNEKLTKELLEMHSKYHAEYSYADGFPYGITPEIIESGTAGILSELALTNLKAEGEKPVSRDALFSVMKGDINSFEIETLISDKDYRLLRLSFEASSKINYLVCKNLYEKALENKISLSEPYELSDLASRSVSVLQTLPAFYNIQISAKYNHKYIYSLEGAGKNPCPKDFMSLTDFKKILSQIKDFSENAVISLSAFGEPLLNPDFMAFVEEVLSNNDDSHRLSLLIETDGLLLTEETASKIASLASSYKTEVNWIVYIDAVEKTKYASIHNCSESDFEKALLSLPLLEKYFEKHVYPQFMRMKVNEEQLESFWRFWNEETSPSKGKLIIQKYNSVCKTLPDLKSADLSPVTPIPCWHLRRDMTILSDGSVPFCFQLSFNEMAGNILSEGIEKVWSSFSRILENYMSSSADNCNNCDESYTFNF